MTLIVDSEHRGRVFSLVWLRLGDVWRAGADPVTIVTFVMSHSLFSFSTIQGAFKFCVAPGLFCLSCRHGLSFTALRLSSSNNKKKKKKFPFCQSFVTKISVHTWRSRLGEFFLFCRSKIPHLHTSAAMFQFPM